MPVRRASAAVACGGRVRPLDLRPVNLATAELATALSGRHRLRAADAVHLATAIGLGADRFITRNKRDFPASISEIAITHPDDLPVAGREG